MEREKAPHHTPDSQVEPSPPPRGPEGGREARGAGDPAPVPVARPRRRRRKLTHAEPILERPATSFTPEQKLILLTIWKDSGLGASDFSKLVCVSTASLYLWRKAYENQGPEGLFGHPKGPEPGSKVDPVTRKTILIIKEGNPEYGCERISQLLYRGPGLGVSASTVSRVLKEEGYESEELPTKRHPDKPRRFERAKPNQMWQSDLFTFTLKRNGHRLHLIAFMDDHSRFITGFGLSSSPTSAFALEVVRTAIGNFGLPEEMLTDQGPQYHTWRGKTAFGKEMRKRGINHILARPRHPQTLGKVERFWKTLWNELLLDAVLVDINEARERIAHFVDFYNFKRPHQGIDGLVPADRFFSAESEVRKMLEKRVADNALELARSGRTAKSLYITGVVGEKEVSLHSEGEKFFLTSEDGQREEVSLDKAEEVRHGQES